MRRLAAIAFALASTALAQQKAPTPTPALSEAQIQVALAEQALLQKWNGMLAEWYVGIENLPSNVYTSQKSLNQLLEQMLRDERTIKDDIERVRLQAKLRGQPEPHVASEEVYQWYRQQGSIAGLAAVDRATKNLHKAYGTPPPKKGGRR